MLNFGSLARLGICGAALALAFAAFSPAGRAEQRRAAVVQAESPAPSLLPVASPTAAATPSPTSSTAPVPPLTGALPPCPTVHVALKGTIDTKIVKPGETFRFVTTAPAAFGDQTIPAGTPGSGSIEVMNHSKSGGQAGYLILDARFLALADGSFVPVAFEPGTDGRSFARIDAGSSSAGLIGYLPFYIGTAAGIYNYFHHGKDAAVVDGTVMPIFLGYGGELGTCSVPVVTPDSKEPAPHF